jgi:hypothetical protein
MASVARLRSEGGEADALRLADLLLKKKIKKKTKKEENNINKKKKRI